MTLYRNTSVGTFSQFEGSVLGPADCHHLETNKTRQKTSSGVSDKFDLSALDITRQQQAKLVKLLDEYADLGRTAIVKHQTNVWTNYEVASCLVKQLKEERTVTLSKCLGHDALEIVDGLSFASEEECKDIDVVLDIREAFCVGETNEIYEHCQFNKWDQESRKYVDSYVAALHTLAKNV